MNCIQLYIGLIYTDTLNAVLLSHCIMLKNILFEVNLSVDNYRETLFPFNAAILFTHFLCLETGICVQLPSLKFNLDRDKTMGIDIGYCLLRIVCLKLTVEMVRIAVNEVF